MRKLRFLLIKRLQKNGMQGMIALVDELIYTSFKNERGFNDGKIPTRC